MTGRFSSPLPWLALVLLLGGCGSAEQTEQADGPPATPVTVAQVQTGDAIVIERTVGRIEAQVAPMVAAEVPGTVSNVRVEIGDSVEKGQTLAELDSTDLALGVRQARAEAGRLEALASNQSRTVERYRKLRRQGNLSEGMLEEAESQLTALRKQLDSARSQLATARRNLEKAIIRAPISGQIQARHIDPGDYVAVAAPLFQIAEDKRLRILLPFPEDVAGRIRPGQTAYLTATVAHGKTVEAPITTLRPVLTAGSRALEALLFIDNPGGWAPGASVTAEVEVAHRSGAILVPEISVVRRPAGPVVFVLQEDGTVSERLVITGVKRDGRVEIRTGLEGGEQVIVDGAGFLTNGARVQVSEQP